MGLKPKIPTPKSQASPVAVNSLQSTELSHSAPLPRMMFGGGGGGGPGGMSQAMMSSKPMGTMPGGNSPMNPQQYAMEMMKRQGM